MQKSLLTRISETIDQYRNERQAQSARTDAGPARTALPPLLRWFLPNGGTLLLVAILIFTQNVWAGQALRNLAAESAASTGTIAYQGRLADSSGTPLTSTLPMSFRLYSAVTGGAPLWTEQWTGSNGVKVSDGLFNVMLGSLTPIPQSVITGNANLFLGITVGTDDEMTPRVQLGSVPFAVQALTVPDGSVTTRKVKASTYTKRVEDFLTVNGAPAWEFKLMTPLSITIPALDLSVPTKALVLFDARCRPLVDVSILQFAIALDGEIQNYTDAYPPASQMVPVSLHALVDLTPNVDHTISVVWNPIGLSSGTAECVTRSLTVILLGQS